MSSDARSTSRIGIYCRAWLSIVVCALVLRSTVFFGPCGEHCGLSFVYTLVTWPSIIVLHFMNHHRLKLYLQRYHSEKWKELDGYGGDGFATYKSLRRHHAWFGSNDDLGDPAIAVMKKDQTLFIPLVLGVFFSEAIMFPLLTYDHVIWPFSNLLR